MGCPAAHHPLPRGLQGRGNGTFPQALIVGGARTTCHSQAGPCSLGLCALCLHHGLLERAAAVNKAINRLFGRGTRQQKPGWRGSGQDGAKPRMPGPGQPQDAPALPPLLTANAPWPWLSRGPSWHHAPSKGALWPGAEPSLWVTGLQPSSSTREAQEPGHELCPREPQAGPSQGHDGVLGLETSSPPPRGG